MIKNTEINEKDEFVSSSSTVNTKNTKIFAIPYIFLVLFIFSCIGFVIVYFYVRNNYQETKNNQQVKKVYRGYSAGMFLQQNDKDYEKANFLLSKRKVEEALPLFSILQNKYATGTTERYSVELALARGITFDSDNLGDNKKGVDLLYNISISPNFYNDLTRAFAIESIIRAHYTFHDLDLDKHILEKPFPIKFSKDVSDLENYLKLSNYGLSIAVTPYTSSMASYIHGIILAQGLKTSIEKTKNYSEYVKNNAEKEVWWLDYLERAEKEVSKINVGDYSSGYISSVYVRMAMSYTNLENYFSQTGRSEKVYNDKITLFYDKALNLSVSNPYVPFHYAEYLANKNKEDPKIEQLVMLIVQNDNIKNVNFDKFIVSTLTDSAQKGSLAYKAVNRLVEASPNFRKYVDKILEKK